MVFSSPIFLFFFLPAAIGCYFLAGRTLRNASLLLFSLAFYTWGEPRHLPVLLISIVGNFTFGLALDARIRKVGQARLLLALGVGANLAMLGVYKYLGFILDNLGVANAYDIAPTLPIGISFFTFQALSYLVDLHRGEIHVQRSLPRLALYISMFPQLIAGPIVRYAEVENDLIHRTTRKSDFAAGMQRFAIGLAKKSLIADPMGLTADNIYALEAATLSPQTAWIGAIAYMLQIYFDFSAYSDMAIGLGRIFGFHFPENFDHPYTARTVTEFWRRWHMTLSRWFRDYLYIPLGGSRAGALRTYLNLLIVFLATGIWHGAAWTFVFWGLYHGAFLILERLFLGAWLKRVPAVVSHLYLLVVVIFGWVLFRAEDIGQATDFVAAMLLWQEGPLAVYHPLVRYFDAYVLCVMIAGVAFSLPIRSWIAKRTAAVHPSAALVTCQTAAMWILFLSAVVTLGAASYSPFLYFRF